MANATKIPQTSTNAPFVVSVNGSAVSEKEALKAQLAQIEAIEAQVEAERKERDYQQKQKQQETDFLLLDDYETRLAEAEESLKYVTDKEGVAELLRTKRKLVAGITEIKTKYGLNQAETQEQVNHEPKKGGFIKTAWKIAALLLACWGIVLYSGDWIVSKYPAAAVYNEVSFQKVLFGFSVFVGGVVSVVVILVMFFPGLARYFNPFNHHSLDFYDDFQKLTEWQRNTIALVLFLGLLLSYVLIVGGKLD
jgi:hypothetical protein